MSALADAAVGPAQAAQVPRREPVPDDLLLKGDPQAKVSVLGARLRHRILPTLSLGLLVRGPEVSTPGE
jgi:hypothetical protein